MSGLRERKKDQTRRDISIAAIELFLDKGFDEVSVADVATAAGVSKPTVFNYFLSKEHLVLHRFEDHVDDTARAVSGREPGEAPLAALRRNFLYGLEQRDSATGLTDRPDFLAFHRMIQDSPTLKLRALEQRLRSEDLLAEVFAGLADSRSPDVGPALAASLVIATHRTLVDTNVTELMTGRATAEIYPLARDRARYAFSLLGEGLPGYLTDD